jgi:hypothetical protein
MSPAIWSMKVLSLFGTGIHSLKTIFTDGSSIGERASWVPPHFWLTTTCLLLGR